MYGRGFLVLIPAIYVAMGLNPIQAGLMDGVRQLAGGATSMTGGFFVDIFQHRRAQVLTLSLALIGVGYLLVSIAPSYALILAALAIASAGTAMWHPPALGLLAQRFPRRRGLFISMHRSTGNLGDWNRAADSRGATGRRCGSSGMVGVGMVALGLVGRLALDRGRRRAGHAGAGNRHLRASAQC